MWVFCLYRYNVLKKGISCYYEGFFFILRLKVIYFLFLKVKKVNRYKNFGF